MRNPNDFCVICNDNIYRRPSDIIKCPKGYCKKHKHIAYKEGVEKKYYLEYSRFLEMWKNGLVTGMKGKTGISNHIRKYLITRSNNKCEKCGWNEINIYTKKVPLEINHKDGNYLNNIENNLEYICPNCHSLTSSYRGANKGKGRPR